MEIERKEKQKKSRLIFFKKIIILFFHSLGAQQPGLPLLHLDRHLHLRRVKTHQERREDVKLHHQPPPLSLGSEPQQQQPWQQTNQALHATPSFSTRGGAKARIIHQASQSDAPSSVLGIQHERGIIIFQHSHHTDIWRWQHGQACRAAVCQVHSQPGSDRAHDQH